MAQNSRRLTAKSSLLRSSWWPLAGGWCDVMPTTPDNMRSRPIEPRAISEKKIKRTKIIVSPVLFSKASEWNEPTKKRNQFQSQIYLLWNSIRFSSRIDCGFELRDHLDDNHLHVQWRRLFSCFGRIQISSEKNRKVLSKRPECEPRGSIYDTSQSTRRVKIPFSNGILFFIYF